MIIAGDCLQVLAAMPAESVRTDCPIGLAGRQMQTRRAAARAAQAQQLYRQGANVKFIAAQFNCSLGCVYNWLKRPIDTARPSRP